MKTAADSDFFAKTVLVIDDEEIYQKQFREIIESDLKAKYRSAPNPHVAFELLKKLVPDLIILDMQMPLMDGLNALHLIRAHPVLKRITVIATSDETDETTVHLVAEQGIADFIVKPFASPVARARIEKVLRKQLR